MIEKICYCKNLELPATNMLLLCRSCLAEAAGKFDFVQDEGGRGGMKENGLREKRPTIQAPEIFNP